jgi:D-alanine transaminase
MVTVNPSLVPFTINQPGINQSIQFTTPIMTPSPNSPIVYLNGKFIGKDQAFISPEDRGYYFADGVYEVIKYYKGNPFCMSDHLERLQNSLAEVRIEYERVHEISLIGAELIRMNQFQAEFAGIYLQITRGVAPRMHRFPGSEIKPSLYVRAFPMPTCTNELMNGVKVITREDIRWLRCNIKSIALLPNTMLFQEAVEHEAGECFLIRNGNFTEATHSNIMAVKQGIVYTHPDSNLILPGITKKAIIRICSELKLKIVERPIGASEIRDFEEWFITGTGSEITPVIQIDEHKVGNGFPGPVTRQLQKSLFAITYMELAGEVMNWL